MSQSCGITDFLNENLLISSNETLQVIPKETEDNNSNQTENGKKSRE
jgi:hypothetical protein